MVLGFLIFIGYSLKPHTIIIGIGIFIYELIVLTGKKRPNYTKIIKLLFGAILSVVIINALSYDVKRQLNSEKRVRYLHYIKLGLNIEPMGLYSDKDYSDSIKQDNNLNRDLFNKKTIKDRINMIGKTDFNNHFTYKTLINFNDGMFGWSWMVMNDQTSIEKQKRQNVISNIFHKIYGYNTEYSYYFYYVSHVVWILILTLGFFSVFSKNRYRVLFYVSYIGIFLFVSIFESLSRYLFVNVPIFIIVSIYGIDSIDKLIIVCKRKLKIL